MLPRLENDLRISMEMRRHREDLVKGMLILQANILAKVDVLVFVVVITYTSQDHNLDVRIFKVQRHHSIALEPSSFHLAFHIGSPHD